MYRGDYNSRPSTNIRTKFDNPGSVRPSSQFENDKLVMKFQCQFIYCEQQTICTCGLTNVRKTLKYYNHPCMYVKKKLIVCMYVYTQHQFLRIKATKQNTFTTKHILIYMVT